VWCWWLHFHCLEEYRDEFPLLLQHVSHIGHGDLGFNGVAMISGFTLIVAVFGMIMFALAPVHLGLR
jgi:hypothetical protein